MLNVAPFLTTYPANLLVNGAETTVAGQAPMNEATQLKPANPDFEPTTTTYFVRTDTDNNRYTAVLGWDHAMLLEKTDTGYRPRRVYSTGNKAAYNDIAILAVGKLTALLPHAVAVARLCETDWEVLLPPDIVLERIITYGVSSCSFAVQARLPDWNWIAISHMSGIPPVPVAEIMKDANVPAGNYKFFASAFPQVNELKKFRDSRSLRSLAVTGTVCVRGDLPLPGSGERLFPQLPHTEIGLNLRADPPEIVGILGLEHDTDYPRLIPPELSLRLKTFSKSMENNNLVFEVSYDMFNSITSECRKLFRSKGVDLPMNANFASTGRNWTITVPRIGIPNTVYHGTAVTTESERETYGYDFMHQPQDQPQRKGSIWWPNNDLTVRFNRNDGVFMWHDAANMLGLVIGDIISITTITPDKVWRINLRDGDMTVTIGSRSSFKVPRTRLLVTNPSERRDIILDVIDPLLAGTMGFGALHTRVFNDFKTELQRAGASYVWGVDVFLHFQRSIYNSVDNWHNIAHWKPAVAIMLGDYLNDDARHAYRNIPAAAVRLNRYHFGIPLNQLI